MIRHDDFLVELQTEELPPKSLLNLANAFCEQIKERLQKANFGFSDAQFFATPRRLAVWIKNLASAQPDQRIERKGPALKAAFDADGKPSPACLGFAKSCDVTPEDLIIIKTPEGEWVGFKQQVAGKSVNIVLPEIITQALAALPIPKRMRWGAEEAQFVRPVHHVILLYGEAVIDATILGCKTGRKTLGHRFHASGFLNIPKPAAYAPILETDGFVIADFAARKAKLLAKAEECLLQVSSSAAWVANESLINEVTGLVERPVALLGQFDVAFLQLPPEILISAMQDHQRYFPVRDKLSGKLLAYFITISNIRSHDVKRVIHGNERVLRARLSDAAFFYQTDLKETLADRVPKLKDVVFQAKLGTLYDKTQRVSQLSCWLATQVGVDKNLVERASLLAKADLLTQMVGEFPALQGIMGYYYALHNGEAEAVALAIKEQYMPRFAGDELPDSKLGQMIAMADRLDTLVGAFSIYQIPTGDKDPYGLRRAALGILRILIEKQISLNLPSAIKAALANYQNNIENAETQQQVLVFLQERLKSWYLDQGINSDVFAAVAAVGINDPFDAHKRILAVQRFKQAVEAESLSIANKRVSNILAKYSDSIEAIVINRASFEYEVEMILANQLEAKSETIARLAQSGRYDEILLQLAELRKPIDDFFDQVMVMVDDKTKRENRILLLNKLRHLFLQVADIALLQ